MVSAMTIITAELHSFLSNRFIIIIATRYIILKMIKYSLALVIALFSTLTMGKKNIGLCPQVDSNIKNKEFNVTNMMGIWYEYLITLDLKEGQAYDCASWLML